MRNNSKQIYKLAWFIIPVIFLALLLWKGEFCLMYSCIGDNNTGMAYGIGGVLIYSIILKLIGGRRNFMNVQGIRNGFLYILLVLTVFLVYFLGKLNG